MTIKMLKNLDLRKFTNRQFVRSHFKKYPVEPDQKEQVPVVEMPRKPQKRTTVFAWGCGEHGGLGHYIQNKKKMISRSDPRFRSFKVPFRHSFGEFHDVKDITAGFGFSAFSISTSGPNKVWGTGINTDSQIGCHDPRQDHPLGVILAPVPIKLGLMNPKRTKVIGLSAGRAHLVVVTDNEGVFTLGNNAYGQCGRQIIENEKYSGSRIVFRIPDVGGEKVKTVECGQDHTLFLTESGNVYSCGWGADGQTGLGHYEVQCQPRRVLGDIKGEKIIKVSSRSDCVLAINDKGDVFGWGNSEYSQLFDQFSPMLQINRPVHIKKCEGFGKIIDVAAAGSFCMMLNEEGKVYTWGYGILGQGPNAEQSWTPKLVPPVLFGKNDFQPDTAVTKIFCGLHYSTAINNYGHIYTWGRNKNMCLGLSHSKDQYFPLRVFVAAAAKKVAMGVDHTLALCHPF